jgi:7-cyano-7-deazaguanine synthase in queuosine biosynthesis
MNMDTFNQLKQIILPHLANNKNIGVSISGGFDSAVMFWCCCKIAQQEKLDCRFRAFTVKRGDNSEEHAINIVKYISEQFDINIQHRFVGDPSVSHDQQAWSGIQHAIKISDVVFVGDTNVPDRLKGPVGTPDRKRVEIANCVQPMFDWNKDIVVQLAIDLQLTDIMKLSHTCTESHYDRCNNCWQCGERAWAFEQCNYTDPGNL